MSRAAGFLLALAPCLGPGGLQPCLCPLHALQAALQKAEWLLQSLKPCFCPQPSRAEAAARAEEVQVAEALGGRRASSARRAWPQSQSSCG